MSGKSSTERSALTAPEIRRYMERAQGGDTEALAAIRTQCPRLFEYLGDLATSAREGLVSLACGEDALQRDAIRAQLDGMRRELCGPSPSPLEQLLVERILICWLQANYEDALAAQTRSRAKTWEQVHHAQQCGERAQRRFLSAVKMLATVRRLAVPSVQVNMAHQQVVASISTGEKG